MSENTYGGTNASVYGGVYPCSKCGQMMYPGEGHECPAPFNGQGWGKLDFVHADMKLSDLTLGVDPAKPGEDKAVAQAVTAPGKDKSLIWDDCAECAHKHLTAAYAGLTSGELLSEVCMHEVYAARAVIAIREAETGGYRGNLALATGCLAMAESTPYLVGGQARAYRDARLQLATRDAYLACGDFTLHPTAFIGAHFAEAIRELPAITDRFQQGDYFLGGAFSPRDKAAFAELLIKLIRWVETTYELRGGK